MNHSNVFNNKENLKIQIFILITGICLFLLKIIAWYLTDSISILTDALESIINIASALIGLISLYISNLPKDSNHPNGHGKVEFLTSGFEGILIVLTGITIIYQSIIRIINCSEIGKLDYGIVLLLITAIINYFIGNLSIKYGNKNNSIILLSGGEHLKTDTYSSIGIIIGLILIYITNIIFLDSIIAFIYGFLIIYTGFKITKVAISGIMDESNNVIINKIKLILDNIIDKNNELIIRDIRVINYGNTLHIDMIIFYKNNMKLGGIINKIETFEKETKKKFKEDIDIFVKLKKYN